MFSFVTPVFAETSYHNENYDNLGGISPNTTLLTTCSTYSTSPSSVVFISGITTSFTASSKCDFSGTLAWRVSGGSHNTISTSKTTVFGQTTHTGSFSIPAQASGTSVEIGVVTSSGSFIKTNTYTVQSALSLPTLKVSSFTTQSSESRVLVSWYNNSNLNWQLYVNDEFQSSGNAYYGAFSNIEFSAGYGVKSIVLKDSVSGETLASQTVGVKPSYFTFY